jgi:dephospho-CoA kinase
MKSKRDILYIAVTGGIGTGKSIVADVFEKKGAEIFRADSVAKDLMRNDPEVREALRANFGEATFKPDGTLDTKYLADKVFRDAEKLTLLNSIVHPAVQREVDKRMAECSAPMFVMDAALVYEVEIEDKFDYVVVVDAEEALRIGRVVAREGAAEDDVKRRMLSQIAQSDKVEAADFVLKNNGTRSELETAAAELFTLLSFLPKRETVDDDTD